MTMKITIEDIDDILDEIEEKEKQIEEAKQDANDHKINLFAWIRSTWIIGSFCEIYSSSEHNWFQGEIIKTFKKDSNDDWLQIEYTINEDIIRCKVPRNDDNIVRPLTKALSLYEYTFNAIHQKFDKKTVSFGMQQSPINIITTQSVSNNKVINDNEFQSNPLRFNYPTYVQKCSILNNGHTVQINIDAVNKCTLSIHNKTYELKQFHFHIPSEHLIDSKQYKMEMHLVHINKENEIAVLGFIFSTEGAYKSNRRQLQLTKSRMHLTMNTNTELNGNKTDDDDSDDDSIKTDDDEDWDQDQVEKKAKPQPKHSGNVFLNQFWANLPVNKTEEEIALENTISFDYLFETASDNFTKSVETNEIHINMEIIEYIGSLTTPPYTEGVQWLLSKKRHFISEQQLFELGACWGHKNNARVVQEQFGRMISVRSKSSLRVQ